MSDPDQSLKDLKGMLDGAVHWGFALLLTLAVVASLVVAIVFVLVITRITSGGGDTDSENNSDLTT